MEAQERIIARAGLIATWMIRYYELETAKEVDQSLEILAEELAQITELDEMFVIHGILETYGLQIPNLSSTSHADQRYSHKIQLQRSD